MASEACSLLGLDDDRGAYLTYPSYENRCYSSDAAESIPLNEQTFFCLGGHMERCPRYQATQARQSQGEPAAAGAAAAAMASTDDLAPDVRPTWEADPASGPGQEGTLSYGDDFIWEESTQAGWNDMGPDLPPPPPPYPALAAGPNGPSRRPVWPLLLAAGTLVGVLMICALASAGWIGLRALTSQLTINPTQTPALVAGGTPAPSGGTTTPVASLPTATLEPPVATALAGILATQTSAAATATSAALFPTVIPSPTNVGPVEAPTYDASTPTPTWTPIVFETPTPRDTPVLFPTSTDTPFGLVTATFTPFPSFTPVTATPVYEAFYVSFVANPTAIFVGQTSTLTWTVRGVKAIFLDGVPISGPTGSQIVKPAVTTTYVLRIIMPDNTVREEAQTVTVSAPTPSVTPTATSTPTALPEYFATFHENVKQTTINGSESTCRVDNGCSLFLIQVLNSGNRPIKYWLTKVQVSVPGDWGVYFCWAGDCYYGDAPTPKVLSPGQKETVAINYRVPSVLQNGSYVTRIQGSYSCDGCSNPDVRHPYDQLFTVTVLLPTATPIPTGTLTPTPTNTLTPTATPTPTTTSTPTVTPTSGGT